MKKSEKIARIAHEITSEPWDPTLTYQTYAGDRLVTVCPLTWYIDYGDDDLYEVVAYSANAVRPLIKELVNAADVAKEAAAEASLIALGSDIYSAECVLAALWEHLDAERQEQYNSNPNDWDYTNSYTNLYDEYINGKIAGAMELSPDDPAVLEAAEALVDMLPIGYWR